MTEKEIIALFDEEKYREVLDITDIYKNKYLKDFEVLYYLKSKLVLDDFEIKDLEETKKILFYYFYLVWKVDFSNDYSFCFKKDSLEIRDFSVLEKTIEGKSDFKNSFLLWKNEIFLNKIIDQSIQNDESKFKDWARKVNNLIDFFLVFTHECSELYSFSGEHFPLFKWLINELLE